MSSPQQTSKSSDLNAGALATRTGRILVAIAGIIGGAFLYWALAPIRKSPEFWIGVISLPCLGIAFAITSPWLAKKTIGAIGLKFTVINALLHFSSFVAFWCDTHVNNGQIQQQPIPPAVLGCFYWLTIFPGAPSGIVLSLAGVLRESGIREGKRGLMIGATYWLGIFSLLILLSRLGF